jgi:diketogulonate reductase-like aldo/keto reductase
MASSTPDKVPSLLYGTAFKFDNAADLVSAALAAGFRGVDTAGNKNNYREALVGRAFNDAISRGDVKRDELYVSVPDML